MYYIIRKMEEGEYYILKNFLYEAIFQQDKTILIPKSIIDKPELKVYIENFGDKEGDYCLCAETNKKIIGAVWVRNIKGYGSVDNNTPELAISLYSEYRGQGIGTELMKKMLHDLNKLGHLKVSLAVQKANYASKMYLDLGFKIIDENEDEYIMIYYLE